MEREAGGEGPSRFLSEIKENVRRKKKDTQFCFQMKPEVAFA